MKVALISGGEAAFELQEPDPRPSSYFFSMERSGSSLFWYIVTDLLIAAKRAYCEPLENLFVQGIARAQVDTGALRSLLARPGYVFGMFRSFDEALRGLDLTQNKKFLLIRDPRDVLVSLFFSMARSHRLPGPGSAQDEILRVRELTSKSIDAFVESEVTENIQVRYRDYREFCEQHQDVILFRYEDVIFDKQAWVTNIIRHLDLEVPEKMVRKIVRKHDELPTEERPLENVRQVRPGNWKEYLSADSATRIEHLFAREMAFFGYVPEVTQADAFRQFLPEFCKAVAERLANTERQMFELARERQQTRQTLCDLILNFFRS